MKIEGIIFDWAGTTVDFGCMAPVRAFMDSFKGCGVPVTEEETRKPMGMLKRDHIRTMLAMPRIKAAWTEIHGAAPDETSVEDVYSRFEPELLATLTNFTTVKPDLLPALKTLRAMGLKIGSTTGYTDKMMAIVEKAAADQGYVPDAWFSADATGGKGRPYPYMIFKNMEKLGLSDVRRVIKVGDTVADIKEGLAAGVWSVGVIDGSSVMAVSEDTFNGLSEEEKDTLRAKVRKVYEDAGAHFIIQDLSELPKLAESINL